VVVVENWQRGYKTMNNPKTFSEAVANLKYWVAVLTTEIALAAWPTVKLMKRKKALLRMEYKYETKT